MSNEHLSEEQVQHYAMDRHRYPAAAGHAADCSYCQLQIRAYQMLYKHIREAGEPLLDFKTEELILPHLPKTKTAGKKEALYFYGLLFAPIALLSTGIIWYWDAISPIFFGITPVFLAAGLVLLFEILIMQLIELYRSYRKKSDTLNYR